MSKRELMSEVRHGTPFYLLNYLLYIEPTEPIGLWSQVLLESTTFLTPETFLTRCLTSGFKVHILDGFRFDLKLEVHTTSKVWPIYSDFVNLTLYLTTDGIPSVTKRQTKVTSIDTRNFFTEVSFNPLRHQRCCIVSSLGPTLDFNEWRTALC